MSLVHAIREPSRLPQRLDHLDEANVVPRVWAGDYTVWGTHPAEIINRLGWLRAPETMREHFASLRKFADAVREEGCDAVALIGMGGSSLAPETLASIGRAAGGPRLVVLDTTHPGAVRRAVDGLDPAHSLYLVSTKSGTTTETLAIFRTLHRRAADALGPEAAGLRFAAITDPGSPLVRLAHERGFRRVFLNDPTVGGRYAALSLVGLVPAALLGFDLGLLLDNARAMAARCSPSVPVEQNPAALLAALLAAHMDEGRDKATFVIDEPLAGFGDWVEQLIAESTGKDGSGLVPIVGEPLGAPGAYGEDRVFVRLGTEAETLHPAISVEFAGPEALGGQFLLWELATALLGHLLAVNPFNQPDVESSKEEARKILSAVRERGELPAFAATPLTREGLAAFVGRATAGDYIALLAYLEPQADTDERLALLRRVLRDETRCATTLGYGPRYLHSTGQLHKGDSGRGLFIEFVDDPAEDIDVPDGVGQPIGFRLLVRAQAAGDAKALADRGRRIAVFDLGRDCTSLGAIAPGALAPPR